MAVTSNTVKQCREWDLTDSMDTSDVERLFKPGSSKYTKPVRWVKYWSLYASICVFFALFLLGLIIGFYLRDDPKVLTEGCSKRSDGFDDERLQAVHNNIVYYMSGDRIIDYVRILSPDAQEPYDYWEEDRRTADIVRKEFLSFGFELVDLEEHNVVVTSPDPTQPNRLELLYPGGSTMYNVSENGKGDNLSRNAQHVSHISATGAVEGPVVYGGYGTPADFLDLHTSHDALLQGAVVMVKMGQISISEKVELAKSYGMVGVLVYCEADLCPDDNFVSWDDFIALNGQVLQTMPVQMISQNVAKQLMEAINLPGSRSHKNQGQKQDTDMSVRLHVRGSTGNRKLYNVVGTIRGSEEQDRVVMVAAGRQSSRSCCHDYISSTALLLELGNSLNSIRALEGWKPRRTIKLISLGGQDMANSGLLNYIKEHKQKLDTEAVTFIDLDLHRNGSDPLTYSTTPDLEKLIHMAASMVPDPADPELSLTDSWTGYQHSYPSMHFDRGSPPMMHRLGIPSAAIQGVQVKDKELREHLPQRDITHHYKYHLATARVVSHMLLHLSDFQHLPLDVTLLIKVLQQLVMSTTEQVKQIVTDKEIGMLEAAVKGLSEESRDFPTYSAHPCTSALQTRELNDMLMRLHKTFYHTIVTNRTQHHLYLLQQVSQTGLPFVVSEAVRTYNITGNSKPVNDTVHILTQAMTEVQQMLSFYQGR